MSGPVTLQREHFTVSQDNRYFRPDTLSKMIGQEPNQWRHAALKELIDNALDAAENVHPAITPVISVEFTETDSGLMLSVADNGEGIPAAEIPRIADFSSNSSTKLFYRAPLRGAMGNAVKTLIGMPVALGQERGRLEIETQGQRHTVTAWLTVTGPKCEVQQTATDVQGTRVTALIPGPVECYHWEPARWLLAYGLFNPHAQLQIRKIDPVFSENSEIDDGHQAVPKTDLTERDQRRRRDQQRGQQDHFPLAPHFQPPVAIPRRDHSQRGGPEQIDPPDVEHVQP